MQTSKQAFPYVYPPDKRTFLQTEWKRQTDSLPQIVLPMLLEQTIKNDLVFILTREGDYYSCDSWRRGGGVGGEGAIPTTKSQFLFYVRL